MDDIQTEAQAKRLGKTEQGFGDPRDDIERSAVHVLRVPPDEREQEEMVPTVFSRFDYKYHLTDQVSSRTPKHNKHKATCKDVIIKMLKIARKISRAAKEQWHAHGGWGRQTSRGHRRSALRKEEAQKPTSPKLTCS